MIKKSIKGTNKKIYIHKKFKRHSLLIKKHYYKANLKKMFCCFSPLVLSTLLWVQVPQWSDNWSKCAVDVPDTACHWYIVSPDNTFGKGFNWATAPWFDANGLNDVPKISDQTVVEKLQANGTSNQINS